MESLANLELVDQAQCSSTMAPRATDEYPHNDPFAA